jgi:hypothetical protein
MMIEDLGDGLIMRHATAADADALASFNATMHADPDAPGPDAAIGAWTHDLLARPHPSIRPADFTIVEDTRTGAIVSSLNLISQTWRYGPVTFGVGQVELVATDPAYRRKGLVRHQFDVVHRWSIDRGELVTVVSGIPWYYRQFGYELALEDDGGRFLFRSQIPRSAPSEPEPYRVRPATDDDLPFIMELEQQARPRLLVSAVWDKSQWLYELHGRRDTSLRHRPVCIVESANGTPVGYLVHTSSPRGATFHLKAFAIVPGLPWAAVTPSVLRYLDAEGAARDKDGIFDRIAVELGTEHPVYHALPVLLARAYPPSAWYVRVPDLPAFLLHIAPVLNQRLASSPLAGHTGELRLNFYRHGIRLTFDNGRLTTVEPWPDPDYTRAAASFPDLTFLHLLFCHRSLADLTYAYPDCLARTDAARALLQALFPPTPSQVWAAS